MKIKHVRHVYKIAIHKLNHSTEQRTNNPVFGRVKKKPFMMFYVADAIDLIYNMYNIHVI